MTESAKAGWYRQGDQARYWDGERWTEHYRPVAVATAPPVGPPLGAPASPAHSTTAPLLMMGGAVAVAGGCFLPWIKASAPLIGTITKSGVDNGGDGIVALGLAAILAMLGYRSRYGVTHPRKIGVAIVLGLLVALVVYEVIDISNRFADMKATSDLIATSFGSGLVLMGAGIIAAGIGWAQLPWPRRGVH